MANRKIVNFANRTAVKVSKWKVEPGQTVYPGRALLLYEDDESGKLAKLKSKCVGTVVNLLAKEGEVLNPGDPVLEVEEGCSHPTVINDLCAECGADLQREGIESNATVPMVHHIPQLKVSQQEAEMIGKADTARLLKDRKLVLLVDLDQTLIHTTHDNIPNNIKDVHHFQLGTSAWYHTRLRPNTAHFLKEMSTYFELHICTFGVRPYAHMVANILDRDQSLFSNRILSRDECFNFNSKVANLQALFPNGDELVCIIDDRKDVWNNSPNLIPVKPYVFFTNTGDINDPNLPPVNKHSDFFAKGVKLKKREGNVTSTSASETDLESKDSIVSVDEEFDVEDEDDYLLYLETILKKVHKLFYQVYDKEIDGQPHVRWVLEQLRGSVLKGCEIVFSGLVPLHEGLEKSEPYLMATDLGAKIGKSVCEETTHIVAAREGTAKLHESKKYSKIKIVNPHWLTTCLYRWEQVDERLFPLIKRESDKKSKDSVPLALSFDDVVSMQQEVQAEFNSDSSDSVQNGTEKSGGENGGDENTGTKRNGAEKTRAGKSATEKNGTEKSSGEKPVPKKCFVDLTKPDKYELLTLNSTNVVKNANGKILSDGKPLQTILKKPKMDTAVPSTSTEDTNIGNNNGKESPSVKVLKLPGVLKNTKNTTTLLQSESDKLKSEEIEKIGKLMGVFKKAQPKPVELDFLKSKNTESLRSFQIPKKVTIIDTPNIRIIENNEQQNAMLKIANNKRKKLKLKKNSSSPSSPTPSTSSFVENGPVLSASVNEHRMRFTHMQEEHLLKKQILGNELKNQMDLMRFHFEEHRLKVEQSMTEHSLRLHLMNKEHETKMKLLNSLNMMKIKALVSNCNKLLTQAVDDDESDDNLDENSWDFVSTDSIGDDTTDQ